jgi:anti-sigma factor RsiW
MKHQPYEEWILQDDELSQEQRRKLDDHLSHCEQCASLDRAWRDLESRFAASKLVPPAPGFAARWQEHLAFRRRRRARRHSFAIAVGTFGGLLALAALLFVQLYPYVQQFAGEALRLSGDVVNVLVNVKLAADVLLLVAEASLSTTPLLYRLTLPLIFVGIAYLWLQSVRRLGILGLRKE